MDLAAPHKPTVFSGEFKDTKLTLMTDVPLTDPNAVFVESGCDVGPGCIQLRLLECSGCQVCLLLHESLALCGEGLYDVVLMDGCDECDRTQVRLDASCRITSQTVEGAKQHRGKVCGR